MRNTKIQIFVLSIGSEGETACKYRYSYKVLAAEGVRGVREETCDSWLFVFVRVHARAHGLTTPSTFQSSSTCCPPGKREKHL